jgi:hypothetical protein
VEGGLVCIVSEIAGGGGGAKRTHLAANYKRVAVVMWYRVCHVAVHPYQWSCGAG